MEPVDKIQARVDALRALGLDQTATASDIRNAWRDIAFRAHPDRTGGDSVQFAEAKSAFDLLRREGLVTKAAGPARPRRPKLRARLIELAEDALESCRSLLGVGGALPHDDHSAPCRNSEQTNADHIPSAVGCRGRDLTFFVATPVCEGKNRVALPTSILTSGRKFEAEILSFQATSSGAGEVVVPDTIRERKFPGAKSVRIRFEADPRMSEAF